MASDAPNHIRRSTRKEERVLPILPRQRSNFLQVHHLPKRHTPQRQTISMQRSLAPTGREGLEGRAIPTNGCEVAVVQPLDHRLLRFQARPRLRLVGVKGVHGERPGANFSDFRRATACVVFGEAAADEEDVADVDVSTLRSGTNVNSLRLSYFHEIGVGDFVAGCCIVFSALGRCPCSVVEKDYGSCQRQYWQ